MAYYFHSTKRISGNPEYRSTKTIKPCCLINNKNHIVILSGFCVFPSQAKRGGIKLKKGGLI